MELLRSSHRHGNNQVNGDKLFETRTVGGQTLLTNIANQVFIPGQGSQDFRIQHQIKEMPAGQLSIEVRMSGKIGNLPWWQSASTPSPIPVVDSPQVDLSEVPDTVQQGGDLNYHYAVKNVSAKTIQLSGGTITEGADPPRPFIAAQVLQQNEIARFGPMLHAGITDDLRVTVSINFIWEGGTPSSVAASKTVRVQVTNP